MYVNWLTHSLKFGGENVVSIITFEKEAAVF